METGSFDTSRFDMNSSGEIAQKFHHFKYNLHVNKKKRLGRIYNSTE